MALWNGHIVERRRFNDLTVFQEAEKLSYAYDLASDGIFSFALNVEEMFLKFYKVLSAKGLKGASLLIKKRKEVLNVAAVRLDRRGLFPLFF